METKGSSGLTLLRLGNRAQQHWGQSSHKRAGPLYFMPCLPLEVWSGSEYLGRDQELDGKRAYLHLPHDMDGDAPSI